jgi:inorganic triphosphatase YgiF
MEGAAQRAQLAPVFRTRFLRTAWDLEYRGARIEAVIDEGRIEAGARTEPILEAELELKSGPAEAVWHLARHLSGAAGGRPGLRLLPYGDSKAARGYRLALGAPASPTPARGVPAADAMQSAEQTARKDVAAQMIPLLANALGLQLHSDPEFVHQARVALRRMRSGLEVLGVVLPPPLDRGLQRLGERLGAVRDWDVFCGQLLPRLLADLDDGDSAPWAPVAGAAARQRDTARRQLREHLQEPAFALLSLRLLQWSATPAVPGGAAIGPQALAAVRKRLRRFTQAAPGYSDGLAQRQHRLRLRAKELRYGLDLLGGMLPERQVRTTQRALARFQDAAGRAHDSRGFVELLERLAPPLLRRQAKAWARKRRAQAVRKAQRLAGAISAWR